MRGWPWCAVAASLGAAAGGALVKKLWLAKYREQKTELKLAGQERDLFYTWLLAEQKGARLSEYFSANGYQTVAIFGMNREGRRLAEALGELAAYGVEFDNLGAVHEKLTVYRLGDDPLPPADCMVICDLERIPEKLMEAGVEFSGKLVTLSDVLDWLLQRHHIQPWDGAIPNWPPQEMRR